MTDKQKRKVRKPTISPDRLNTAPADISIENTKEGHRIHAFIKNKEPIQVLPVRLPISIHQKLRKLAFETKNSLNQIVIKAIIEYLKRVKEIKI